MGEIFHALEVLNRTMNLGLSANQLLRAEMGFKSAFAQVSNPNPVARQMAGDPVQLAESFELVATLRPRAQKLSLDQLKTFAGQSVQAPKVRVSVDTMNKIAQEIDQPRQPGFNTNLNSGLSTNTNTSTNVNLPGVNKLGPNTFRRG